MANIKSHTDISQSKTLSKILNHESADMRFCFSHTLGGRTTGHYPMIGREPSSGTIPCWSLAALLNEIPEIINFDDDENDYALEILIENGLYYLSYGNPFEHNKVEIEPKEHFVDACYELILKLNELNLL